MATRSDDIDDDFNDIYKEYTGPLGSTNHNAQERAKSNKRSHAGSDEEEQPFDPNAVPTDFTSREAKVWEAKSKAAERNWKKRKEEEMICKICGESGHFTQGCPSTLGANRKSQDLFERVPARESHVKALFSEKVVQKIEKDIGCKIKIEEKFIIVSGKDRLVLSKGVDAVHKVKEDGNKRSSSSSRINKSRSPERSPAALRPGRSESQKSFPSPQNASKFQHRFVQHEKVVEDRVREDLHKMSRGSLQARAYGKDEGRGRSSRSKSPARPLYKGNSYNSYDNHSQAMGVYRTDGGWDIERRGSNIQSSEKLEYSAFPQTLEELELEYKREAMELGKIRDKEEDEENYKHREAVREIRESYMKKLAILRGMQAKQWEEFVQLEAQRQQRVHQQMSTSGYTNYKQPSYPEYNSSAANYAAANLAMDPRSRYPNTVENYPSSRPRDNYGDFPRQRRDDYGKAYNRY